MTALQGLALSARPDLWESYDQARSRVLLQARPLSDLKSRFKAQATLIERAVAQTGRPESGLVYLPLVGRRDAWTVLLDASTAEPCGFVPLDSF